VAAGTLAPHAQPRRPVCGADIALCGGPARFQLGPEAGPEDLLDVVEAVLTESEAQRAAGGGECRGCDRNSTAAWHDDVCVYVCMHAAALTVRVLTHICTQPSPNPYPTLAA
jgi:hypothetical protein